MRLTDVRARKETERGVATASAVVSGCALSLGAIAAEIYASPRGDGSDLVIGVGGLALATFFGLRSLRAAIDAGVYLSKELDLEQARATTPPATSSLPVTPPKSEV